MLCQLLSPLALDEHVSRGLVIKIRPVEETSAVDKFTNLRDSKMVILVEKCRTDTCEISL